MESYGYDPNGTRTSEINTLRGITGRSLSYSDEDHLLTAGAVIYAYDLDGFLSSKTDGSDMTTYDYSSRGELLEVQLPDGRILSYEHDPLGRRIVKRIDGTIVAKYLWQGLTKLLAIYDDSDNLIQRFEYADGRMPVAMTQAGITYYLAYDPVGTIKVVTDASGNTVKQVDYDAFGNIITDTNTTLTIPFGFAGGLRDPDTGLVRFGYRDYDPDTGRWTAKDPIFFAGGDTNLYGYVLNDPVNLVDPYGLAALYWGTGVTAGLGVDTKHSDDKINLVSSSAYRYAGSTRNDGSEDGMIFSAGAGRIVGGSIGGGPVVGLNFGDVEDLSGRELKQALSLGRSLSQRLLMGIILGQDFH